MKKLFTTMLVVLVAVAIAVPNAAAQSKSLAKDAKKEAKELTKQGWTKVQGTGSLEYCILKYRQALDENPNIHELEGHAFRENPKIGIADAIQTGMNNYAATCGGDISGKILSDIEAENKGKLSSKEIDAFKQTFITTVAKKMNGVARAVYVISRPSDNGKSEFRAFLLYDEDKAVDARQGSIADAWEAAKAELQKK